MNVEHFLGVFVFSVKYDVNDTHFFMFGDNILHLENIFAIASLVFSIQL